MRRFFPWLQASLGLLGVLSSTLAIAEEGPDALFARGKEAYEEGRYEDAIKAYEALHAQGAADASSEYNLGNAYLSQERLGKAILAYERALLLDPEAEDIRENLTLAWRLANEKAKSLTGGRPLTTPEVSLWEALTFGELGVLFLAGYTLFWAAVGVAWLSWPRKRRTLVGLGALAAVACLVLTGLWGQALWERLYGEGSAQQAVVTATSASVRRGAIESAEILYRLPEGEKVTLEEVREGWGRVRLPERPEGWVLLSEVEAIMR